jgi:hypothetical protein
MSFENSEWGLSFWIWILISVIKQSNSITKLDLMVISKKSYRQVALTTVVTLHHLEWKLNVPKIYWNFQSKKGYSLRITIFDEIWQKVSGVEESVFIGDFVKFSCLSFRSKESVFGAKQVFIKLDENHWQSIIAGRETALKTFEALFRESNLLASEKLQ